MAEVREAGFYWVKGKYNNEWSPAKWDTPFWYSIYYPYSSKDNDFSEIGPRLNPPKEEIKRREGHYWVKIKDKKNWEVCYWDIEFKCWNVLGTEITYGDEIIEEIGSKISPSEEKEEVKVREAGFYWVKFNIGDSWSIVYWSYHPTGYWDRVGSDITCTDEDIDVIGPRLSPPEGE